MGENNILNKSSEKIIERGLQIKFIYFWAELIIIAFFLKVFFNPWKVSKKKRLIIKYEDERDEYC